ALTLKSVLDFSRSFSTVRAQASPRRGYLRVGDQLWFRFAEGDSLAHFLDSRGKSFNLLLLLRCAQFLRRDFGFQSRDSRLLFLNFSVLFEELVEQHRIHRFIADSVDSAIFITTD